ncbi:MAG TPA: AzlC family ABC transporter permease [Anaerolineae bacterium]
MTSSRSEFFAGVRSELPISLGVIPFGMIYGVLALGAGLPAGVAMAMSSIVFAGSSQLIGTPLIGAGAPFIVIWLTTLMVNLRHLLYSASVAPYVKHLRPRWKWLLAYVLTDEAYAVTITHYNREELPLANKHWYYLGAGLTLWSTWQVSTAIGLFLGEQIPARWGLDFTLALTFIALVVPRLKDRPSLASSVSAGVVAVLTNAWPYKTGLMVAALIGIASGLWLERKR